MSDAAGHLEALLSPGGPHPAFPPNSRYHATGVTNLETSDGRKVAYLLRRLIPPPERFALLREHVVVQGDRLDLIASHHLGDPELFWQLCDANGAMDPDELTATIGRRLRVALPEGIPGAVDG